MFIGGLSWQTTADSLKQYFSKFGEINECMVVRDPATKRARGFGFITFAQPSSVDAVLSQSVHELDAKKIDPKVAFPKKSQPRMVTRTKKVFIGGLSATSSVDDMKNYFSQFGKIDEAMLMFDKSTNRHRGFGFICFDNEDVVDKICEIHFHEINGKMVECKKAQPKEVMLPTQLEKSRAAAARSLYGLPEQLLATYAASACVPRISYNPGTIIYPAANYYNLLLPGEKIYPDLATLSSPPALALGTRPDWTRSLLNGYQAPAGFISAPTSPTGPLPHTSFTRALPGPSQQMIDFYTAAAGAAANGTGHQPTDLTSFLSATAGPQTIPQFQLKAPQLIAAYNGYH
uniref:RRM domain-containing protein n=1 Tax=Romanomermis culicivorax TaxID=13658 RepID=A0A915IN10_ROMCU